MLLAVPYLIPSLHQKMLIRIQSSTESGDADGVVVIEYDRPFIVGIIAKSAAKGGRADLYKSSKSAYVAHLS